MTTAQIFKAYFLDLKAGKNLLVTITFIASIGLVIARLAGYTEDKHINIGILTILSVFLLNSYLSRIVTADLATKVEKLNTENITTNLDDFIESWHDQSFSETIKQASAKILLQNRIGHNLFNRNYNCILDSLNRGCEINVIIGDEAVAEHQAKWHWNGKKEEVYRGEYTVTLSLLKKLESEKTQGRIIVKSIPVSYSYSLVLIDPASLNSKYLIAPYSFPTRSDYGWQINGNNINGKNFSSFIQKDFEYAWKSGTEIKLQ